MHRTTGRTRLGLALAVLAAAVGAAGLTAPLRGRAPVAPSAPIVPAPVSLPDSLGFEVRYAGPGSEGVDLIWRGPVGGATPGQATIRIEYAGPTADRAMPVWPVNAWLFLCADDRRGSFAAELSGSMTWPSGSVRVTGLVSDGVGVGTPLELRMRVDRPDLSGRAEARFFPGVALGIGVKGEG